MGPDEDRREPGDVLRKLADADRLLDEMIRPLVAAEIKRDAEDLDDWFAGRRNLGSEDE